MSLELTPDKSTWTDDVDELQCSLQVFCSLLPCIPVFTQAADSGYTKYSFWTKPKERIPCLEARMMKKKL